MFSMLPTVLACFPTFFDNSLCHSLCLRSVKKAGFHGAILVIRNSWAMGSRSMAAGTWGRIRRGPGDKNRSTGARVCASIQ